MSTREKALVILNQYGIPYTLEEHDPVYTMEEMEQLPLEGDGSVVKNLFLKRFKRETSLPRGSHGGIRKLI